VNSLSRTGVVHNEQDPALAKQNQTYLPLEATTEDQSARNPVLEVEGLALLYPLQTRMDQGKSRIVGRAGNQGERSPGVMERIPNDCDLAKAWTVQDEQIPQST
jgi:hypothetical protein